MPKVWVCNASPIILLGRINQLKILLSFARKIIVPSAVIAEVSFGQDIAPIVEFLNNPIVKQLETPLQIESNIAGWDLGKGESEVLTWASKNGNAEAILDDLSARKCARSLGIPVRGTVGIILLAKQNCLITNASPIVKELLEAGLHFDKKWLSEALALVNEQLDI